MLIFEWDQGNIDHIAKHGITPGEAEQVVLNNPVDLEFQVRSGEERIAQVGQTDTGRILVVVTTVRDELIRVVTGISGQGKAPEGLSDPEGKYR